MNILVIGNGGREHAMAWKIKQSPLCRNLYVAPGNAGTALLAKNVAIEVEDFKALGEFCKNNDIHLIVVGPEVPLVKGIRDYFELDAKLKEIPMVGPGRLGAQLEGSKDFSKQFMLRNNIPTARAKSFGPEQLEEAKQYFSTWKPPIVLKADGLAAGKGVIISPTIEEAQDALEEMLIQKKFGEASSKVLVEEYLDGIELSVFVLTDGQNYVILPEAKDYKRIGDGDTGPNTGGMGAVTPVPFANREFMDKVEEAVVKPTIKGLHSEGIPYKGFIFIGLMNVDGDPYVIEYNVRMGDPETQAVLPRIKTDLVELLLAAGQGNIDSRTVQFDEQYFSTVVMVAGGYPDSYEKGNIIEGLEKENKALIFHAGSSYEEGKVVTTGGRVLSITGQGTSLKDALEKAYEGASTISWKDVYYRKDIGQDLLKFRNY